MDGDGVDDAQAKAQRAIRSQFVSHQNNLPDRSLLTIMLHKEALGINRRERISEDDFKENLRPTAKASTLEIYRRVNQRGTAESRVSTGVKKLLSVWSSK